VIEAVAEEAKDKGERLQLDLQQETHSTPAGWSGIGLSLQDRSFVGELLKLRLGGPLPTQPELIGS
jgi:hypothetical protein